MEYIEFIGVSGIGKSTTYRYLGKKYRNSSKWILFHELSKNTYYKNMASLEFILRAIFKPRTLPRLAFDWDRLEKFIADHPALLDRFWQSQPMNGWKNGKDLRFQVVPYILGIMEKIQTIDECKTDKLCIVDEGMVHNLNYFTSCTSPASEKDYRNQLAELLDLIELPTAVVHFSGNVDTVVDRTFTRGKLKPRDRNLNPGELRESRLRSMVEKQLIVDVIGERNIPVLRLETEESISVNSEKISSFIEGLDKHEEVNQEFTPQVING